jgi:hypothetical protein
MWCLPTSIALQHRRLKPAQKKRSLIGLVFSLIAVLMLFLRSDPARAQQTPRESFARGPLRVCPQNPRYFCDSADKPVFLTGSHTWGNLQDYRYASLASPAPMNFNVYLEFLQQHHHNFFRLWAWESAMNPGAKQGTIYYDPMPFERPGPAAALDGKPRFDLTRFNPAYFERLRNRVKAARDHGIYASVMLFNGFSIEGKGNVGGDPWQGHPFNPKNNVNGLDGLSGTATHTLSNPAVTAYQEAYIGKVIDTVNDLDNVLYEISNEDTASPADTEWQYHMIRFIKKYEAGKPRQHPVGMTAAWPGTDDILYQSPGDWVSPAAKLLASDGRKVILNDTDHSYFWIGLKQDGPAAQRSWAWENFTLGSQCLFMDPYLDPSHDNGRNAPADNKPDLYYDGLREVMGQTRKYAEKMNLAAALPHPELASSQFCLADPGKQYLVFLPRAGEVDVDLSAAAATFNAEWLRPIDGTVLPAAPVQGGAKSMLKTPFKGESVLYLWR